MTTKQYAKWVSRIALVVAAILLGLGQFGMTGHRGIGILSPALLYVAGIVIGVVGLILMPVSMGFAFKRVVATYLTIGAGCMMVVGLCGLYADAGSWWLPLATAGAVLLVLGLLWVRLNPIFVKRENGLAVEKKTSNRLRWFLSILCGIVVFLGITFLVYFPGRQTPIAFTLATGIGVSGLQERVDRLTEKAIKKEEFGPEDKRFLLNLYSCFAKGARLTVVLRQSSQMMRRYLSKSGEDLNTDPRIFVKSRPVREQMSLLRQQVVQSIKDSEGSKRSYASAVFYMGDPEFFDSFVGLYYGHIIATPGRTADGAATIRWRAECPWEWPSYDSLFQEYGKYHAQQFSLPNAGSILFGSRYCLRMDDGLGGYLVNLDLARPFLVYSEWAETLQ